MKDLVKEEVIGFKDKCIVEVGYSDYKEEQYEDIVKIELKVEEDILEKV